MADLPDNSDVEEWRDIPNWEGFYQASNLGRVRSLPRKVLMVGGACYPVRGRILQPRKPASTGYLAQSLCRSGERKNVLVHRLVCEAFHGPPPSSEFEVAHNNGVRTDNRASNLRWSTRKDNHADKRAHGTSQEGGGNSFAKLTECDVREIRTRRNERLVDLAREFRVDISSVWKVRHYKSWRHI